MRLIEINIYFESDVCKKKWGFFQNKYSLFQTNAKYGSNLQSETFDLLDGLEMIPDYSKDDLTLQYLASVKDYLSKAFTSPFHPLENLLISLCDCFNTTYGGVKVYPRLLTHAVNEVKSIVEGVYFFVRVLFPALPKVSNLFSQI